MPPTLYKKDFVCDPPKFYTNVWPGSKLLSLKAPTAVLLDENKELVAFGYEAENQFSDLVSENEHKTYFYFPSLPCTSVILSWITCVILL
jgi:hypothetical protein